ncbi:MAG: oligosaccharide flippase family protein [Chloroflexi bacterium]|nr:oligosaccharide flippase family protein [Chloroflexota bacterium]
MDLPETIADSAEAVLVKRKTSFAGDVLKLVSGTAIAQFLGIAASPILTRLYPPEAFGILALFTSITSILGVMVCMRYELAIMLPESDEEAANLLGVSLFFTIIVSLLTVLVVWLVKEPLLYWLNAPGLRPYLWLLPVAVFVSGVFGSLNYWNSRTKHFGRISIAQVSRSVLSTSVQLGLGFVGFATGGTLIGASVGGSALATAVLGGQTWREDKKLFLGSIKWQEMLQEIKRYRKFPLYDTWSALLNTASWQLPVLMLSSFFSSTIVGYYAFGYRILQIPMSFIGSAIGQVFFQRASEAHLRGELAAVVENTFQRLVMIGLFPMLMLTFIGHDLFAVIFGATWAEAGVYTQILSIWAFLWFVSSPLSTIFNTLEKQEFLLKFNMVNFATRFAALYMGGILQEPRIAVSLFAGTGVLVYGYLLLSILTAAGVSLHRIVQILTKPVLMFLPAGSVLLYLFMADSKIEIRLLVAGFLLGLYFLFLIKTQFTFNIIK